MSRLIIVFCSIYLFSCFADVNIVADKDTTVDNYQVTKTDAVNLTIYYESLCPDCKNFFIKTLRHVVTSLEGYLNLQLVPYGNAETKTKNGTTVFKCQHGPAECYGNKLHGCAIHIHRNESISTLYNICLMSEGKSNDETVRECGRIFSEEKISEDIIKCANTNIGTQLLKHYGEITRLLNPKWVPTVTLNGCADNQTEVQKHLLENICELLKNPPRVCQKNYSIKQI